jgi:hypothetical protein
VLKHKLFKTAAVGASALGVMGASAGTALAQDNYKPSHGQSIKQSQSNNQDSKAKTDQSNSPTNNSVGSQPVLTRAATGVLVRRRPPSWNIKQSGNHANTNSSNSSEQSQKAKQSGDPKIDQSQSNNQDSKAKTDQSNSPTTNSVGSRPELVPFLVGSDGGSGGKNKVNQSGNHANTSSSNSNEQEQKASQR